MSGLAQATQQANQENQPNDKSDLCIIEHWGIKKRLSEFVGGDMCFPSEEILLTSVTVNTMMTCDHQRTLRRVRGGERVETLVKSPGWTHDAPADENLSTRPIMSLMPLALVRYGRWERQRNCALLFGPWSRHI